ncbi:hypothetical protein [Xanthomonas sp. WHRI 7945]|nr:hypothetical protein [Xanthomonas campestris pv. campestris]
MPVAGRGRRTHGRGAPAADRVSHLGLIAMPFGLSTPTAVVAGVVPHLNRALLKASLFMAAGIVAPT